MCSKIGIITCGPSEALVVSGLFHGNKPKVVVGGRTLVFPGLQKVQLLPLNTHTLSIKSNTVYTSQGVPISVTGVAQVKLESKNDEMLMAAAEQFGSKSEKEIADIMEQTFEGHQRAIMGSMTVEQIVRDRKVFATNVFEAASKDVVNMGMTIVS